MTKENKLKIGLALHKIAMASSNMTLERICEPLKTIEDIVAKEPEREWIPVKEKLPEIQDGKLRSDIVWSCQKYRDGYMWQSTDQCTSDGTWISEVPFDDPRERCKVVAWMPLPEPYEEGAVG